MNVAGKSLQDIYDSGSRRLNELEEAAQTGLADAAEAHLDSRARVEPDALKQLEECTDELQSEIKAFLQRGLERVQKNVDSEINASEHHINNLVEGLVLVTKKFSESIGQLRRHAEEHLSDLAKDSEHVYSLIVQRSGSELLKVGAEYILEAREDATAAEKKLGSQIESSWESVYTKESEALVLLSDSFERDSGQISERFDQSQKSIEERAEERLRQLQNQAESSQQAIEALVQQILQVADRYTFDTDVKLKEGFSSRLYELSTSFDESASEVLSQINALHENSMSDLNGQAQNLKRDMTGLADEITGNARSRNTELQLKGSEMLDNYTSEQRAKLDASKTFHEQLQNERSEKVSEIMEELADLRSSFENKLKSLSISTLDKMRSICDEAESAIVDAQHKCRGDSKKAAAAKQNLIEKSVKDFLERISKTKKAALDRIAQASGEEPPAATQAATESMPQSGLEEAAAAPDDCSVTELNSNLNNPRPVDENEAVVEAPKRKKNKTEKKSAGDGKK